MKRIVFLCNKYPNSQDPNGLVFVQQLVWSIADLGYECFVICPLAVNICPKLLQVPYERCEENENHREIHVYFPKYFGVGQSYRILGKSPAIITTHFFSSIVKKTITRHEIDPDIIYGHFVTPAGICAARLGRQLNIPSFLAHGESTTWSIDNIGVDRVKEELKTLNGVIAVSSRNRELIERLGVYPAEKIGVFPNGYRSERFFPRDRIQARSRFGWNKESFVIGFVGSFDDRKGIMRLQKAVEEIGEVLFACAGKGKLIPDSKYCLFAGPIDNAELPYFYSAIDVFVLPTQNEGCCNAIIEAMACGCPIISSDRSFNYDICDESNSILVDPDDVEAIREAIEELYKDEKKRKMLSNGSIKRAKKLTLAQRAENIMAFINQKSDQNFEEIKD